MERRQLYGGVVALAGSVLAAIQVVHALERTDSGVVAAVDGLPMTAVALALAFAGTRLARDGQFEPDLSRVLGWTVGGTIVFVSFAALTLFADAATTGRLVGAKYLAVDNLTMGATAGILVGLYDARSRRRLRQLETERDRVGSFASKAADLNNYGRAISQCDSVAGVSAFSIEAVSSLLSVDDAAFVEVIDGEVHVVDNTIVDIDRETVEALVTVALDQEAGTVDVHDESPVPLERDVGGVVTIHVADEPESSVAMVALTDAADGIEDTDRQLLELLVSHAGTALDRIDARGTA
ncbi:MAG: hypothetical protein ABEJ40_11095 [Haloarculaceae archaeon]